MVLLYSVLEQGNFLNSDISQVNVATFVRYGGIFNADFIAKFTDKCASDRIF